MKTWADVNELPKYLKKAQALDEKLQEAADIIDAFNTEEISFGWDVTIYPVRLQILSTMKPFLALYEISNEFLNKRDTWLNGPRGDINPDNVDQVKMQMTCMCIRKSWANLNSNH